MADIMVQNTQMWLNQTYGSDPRYNVIEENGSTGWPTIYALTRALQIELGIQNTADSFGPTTQALYAQNLLAPSLTHSNKHSILQGALWCKGYATNYTSSLPLGQLLGDQFDQNVTDAVLQLKSDAGITTNDATVTVNFMKALLSMDAFVLLTLYGGDANIRAFQQEMNRKYETFTGIMPTDGLYGRNTNTALIFALQYEQQMPISVANGKFGPTTRSLCPTIPYDDVAKSYLGLTTHRLKSLVLRNCLNSVYMSMASATEPSQVLYQL